MVGSRGAGKKQGSFCTDMYEKNRRLEWFGKEPKFKVQRKEKRKRFDGFRSRVMKRAGRGLSFRKQKASFTLVTGNENN